MDELLHAGASADDTLQVVAPGGANTISKIFQRCFGKSIHSANRSAEIVRNTIGELFHLNYGLLKRGGAGSDHLFEFLMRLCHSRATFQQFSNIPGDFGGANNLAGLV